MSSSSSRVVDATFTRRQFTIATAVAGAGLILPMRSPAVFAQEQDLSSAGLPTLDITVTANGYEGIPESLEAGRYLVTVTAGEDVGEFGGGVAFIQPAGMTGDEFITMLGEMMGGPDESGVGSAAATPIEGGAVEASPAAEGEGSGLPPFLFESVMAGGTYAGPGQSSRVVLDLTPGPWVAWGDDPASAQQPVAFEATGEMPAELAEPESTATMTMFEYDIQVTEGELTTGSYVVRVDNVGAQPHFISWVQVTEGTTKEQVVEALEVEGGAMMTGTPPAYGEFNPEEDVIAEVGYSGTQSNATSQWIEVTDVQAGTHVLICFFPDISDGMPHAFHGMVAVVEISE
jgi:hypothetical protein